MMLMLMLLLIFHPRRPSRSGFCFGFGQIIKKKRMMMTMMIVIIVIAYLCRLLPSPLPPICASDPPFSFFFWLLFQLDPVLFWIADDDDEHEHIPAVESRQAAIALAAPSSRSIMMIKRVVGEREGLGKSVLILVFFFLFSFVLVFGRGGRRRIGVRLDRNSRVYR